MKVRRFYLSKFQNLSTGGSSEPRKTSLPKNHAYVSHNNIKHKIRNLKRECRPVYKFKDEDSLDALERVTRSTSNEYSKLMLIYTAMDIVQNNKDVLWAEAMNAVLDKIEDDIYIKNEEEKEKQNGD